MHSLVLTEPADAINSIASSLLKQSLALVRVLKMLSEPADAINSITSKISLLV